MSSVATSIVTAVLESVRSAFLTSEAPLFAGRLLAWVAFSHRLPPELSSATYKAGDPRALLAIWERISQTDSLGDVRWAFAGSEGMNVEGLSQAELARALDKANVILLVDK